MNYLKIISTVTFLTLFFTACGSDTPVDPVNKATWIKESLSSIKDYPRIKGISYWNEQWEQYDLLANLKIDSSPESLSSYKTSISDNYFISEIELDSNKKVIAPKYGSYTSAYPGFIDNNKEEVTKEKITIYESLSAKSLAWIYFSDDWSESISFPAKDVALISKLGKVPFIRLMLWSSYQIEGKDPKFDMQSIIDGKFDNDIKKWALEAKSTNTPLMIEYGTEVNGDWFPWNGKWNGKGISTEYGDKNIADGPERFRDAYQHIIDIFKKENVTNVTWAFHVNAISSPDEKWNTMKAYYPGDDYIDWIGISIYGPINQNDPDNYSFREILEHIYPEFSSISKDKPLAIFEFGVGEY